MIGRLVNDAHTSVREAWDWTDLRSSFTVNTVADTSTYALTDWGPRSKILYVDNETRNFRIPQESLARVRQLDLWQDGASGTIQYWTLDNLDSNNDLQIRFWQTPNAVEAISVYGIKRDSTDLVNDTDQILVPTLPIIQYAFAYALRERGETGGQNAMEQEMYAQRDLQNAISLDANQHPEELIWRTV